MEIGNFSEMYIAELQELYSVESQLMEALPKMAKAAQHEDLREALNAHLEETRTQRDRLEGILSRHNANPRQHIDQAMAALIDESEKMAQMLSNPALIDAGIIASAQKVEHYEIAAYGSVATYAGLLGHDEDQTDLHATLEEEKAADTKLTDIAKRIINPDAIAA